MILKMDNLPPIGNAGRCYRFWYPGVRRALLIAATSLLTACGHNLHGYGTERVMPSHQTENTEAVRSLTVRPYESLELAPKELGQENLGATRTVLTPLSQIAVILPLSGPAGRFGRAIRQGLEAQKNSVGWASGPVPKLRFYDTSVTPVMALLAQAEKEGATLVLGPLLKPHVKEVLKSASTLNVLALNLPENPVSRENLCYFSLSPEDEARSAARHIHEQNKHFPLLLLPHGELGGRVADAFRSEWKKQGGEKVQLQLFGPIAALKAAVNSGRGISLARSRERGIDSVYMVATPTEALYLRALIVMGNGSRSGAMLYASSRSISHRSGDRLEMDGLQFSDIPLLSGQNPPMRQRALNATQGDYALARLYAMGADAWMLAAHYSQLHQNPGMVLKGNTGELSVTADCVITRALPWLRYQNGRVIPAS